MKYMLEQMYQLYSEENELRANANKEIIEARSKEQEVYNALCDNLSKKEKELLNQFMDLYYNRRCNDVVEAYKDGFSAGALLMIEIFTKD